MLVNFIKLGLLPFWGFLVLMLMTGCKDKQLSYVDMIKRENGEIKVYLEKQKLSVIKASAEDVVNKKNEFVEVKDGLYISVLKRGTIQPKEKDGILVRFEVEGIGDRARGTRFQNHYNGAEPLATLYSENSDRMLLDPRFSVANSRSQGYNCAALYEAMKVAGVGNSIEDATKVEIITSFRYGPLSFGEQGISAHFKEVLLYKKP